MTNENNVTGNTYEFLNDYIEAYQNGKEDALYDLISYKTRSEKNGDGGTDQVVRLNFSDPMLNKLYYDLLMKYYLIDRTDLDSWVLSCLCGDTEGKGILSQANTKFEPKQLISWVRKRLDGHIKNMIKKERLFDEDIIRDVKQGEYDDEGKPGSYLDDYAYSEWSKPDEYDDSYSAFIEKVGIESLLTSKQSDIFLLYKSGLTQEQIAEKLDVTQSNVSQTINASLKKIRTSYLDYKTYQLVASNSNSVYKQSTDFLRQYENIISYDSESTFDYYHYTRDFMLKNMTSRDTEMDYGRLSKNLSDTTVSLYDVLMDNCKPTSYELIERVLREPQEATLTILKRDRDRFVMSVLASFYKFETNAKKSISNINKSIVENVNADDFHAIGKLIAK